MFLRRVGDAMFYLPFVTNAAVRPYCPVPILLLYFESSLVYVPLKRNRIILKIVSVSMAIALAISEKEPIQ